jgi:hypothetical protein
MGAFADYSPRAASPTRDAPQGYRRDQISLLLASILFLRNVHARFMHARARTKHLKNAARAYARARLNRCPKSTVLKAAHFRARCVE